MDGGGRLARSMRSPGPQADLKAAAIGAAVLLRERLGFNRAGARQRPEREYHPHRLIALLERYIPHRAGVAATALMLLGSAGYGIVKGGHLEELTSAASDTRNAIANSAGFRITAVAINGRKQLTQDEVLAIGGVNGRSSLLFLDAAAVREKLKANPWIGEATVLKLYPGQLQIDIVERSAFALWQQDGRLPENDVGNALAALSKLDKEDRLFSRDIVAVDMRLPDRLIVQLSEDAAKAREELFKDKKPKKKAGDA